MLGSVARPLWVLLGAVAIVLLIACANVANLFLVRAEGRQRDLAVRRAIGAARAQLVRSQMAEALVVAAARRRRSPWCSRAVSAARSSSARRRRAFRASATSARRWRTLLFTLAAALVAALALRLAAGDARVASRTSTRLRDGGRGATRQPALGARRARRRRRRRSRSCCSSARRCSCAASGRCGTWTRATTPRTSSPSRSRPRAATSTTARRSRDSTSPSWTGCARCPASSRSGSSTTSRSTRAPPTRAFRTGRAWRATPTRRACSTSPSAAGDYFKTMGIRLLARPRRSTTTDQLTRPGNVILSRSAANLLWPGKIPIGRRLQRRGHPPWETVVGVVEDVMQDDFRDPAQPLVYFPLVGPTPTSWAIGSPAYVVKTRAGGDDRARRSARWCARSRRTRRCIACSRWRGSRATRWCSSSFTMLTLGVVVGARADPRRGRAVRRAVVHRRASARARSACAWRSARGPARCRRMVVAQGARVVAVGVAIGVGRRARVDAGARQPAVRRARPSTPLTFAVAASR